MIADLSGLLKPDKGQSATALALVDKKSFDAWLQATLVGSNPAERVDRLLHWDAAPAARQAHPQEDHLVPLMVAVGAAENEKAAVVYHEENLFGGVTASSFRFGEAENP